MKAKEKFQRLIILLLVSVSFFFGGFYYGKRGYEFDVKLNPPEVNVYNRNPGDRDIDFGLYWRIWDIVSQDYLDRPVDSQALLYGSIKGMVDALGDDYSAFLPPEVNEAVNNSINSSYQGIGAELGMKENQLMVVAPLDGSPAKEAGLKAGDWILEIEGESTAGITITEAVIKIRGDAGTISTLTIARENQAPKEIKIQRGLIKIESVTWKDEGEGTAYIRISRFGEETNGEWDDVVADINKNMQELDAIILDLRGNPGGYMTSPVYIAGDFMSKGKTILIQQSATGDEQPYKTTKKDGVFLDVPEVFILIDEGSASASEILAAALKDNIKAKLIGVKSFGKGTIQDAQDFTDGSGLHLTTGKWLTPKKDWVHEDGIEPDVKVEISDEDIENGYDAQLEKAIELANEI